MRTAKLTRHATRTTRTRNDSQLGVGRTRRMYRRAYFLGALRLTADAQTRFALVHLPVFSVLKNDCYRNAKNNQRVWQNNVFGMEKKIRNFPSRLPNKSCRYLRTCRSCPRPEDTADSTGCATRTSASPRGNPKADTSLFCTRPSSWRTCTRCICPGAFPGRTAWFCRPKDKLLSAGPSAFGFCLKAIIQILFKLPSLGFPGPTVSNVLILSVIFVICRQGENGIEP